MNLLQSDQSLLTTDQWTLLTNLFHCFKESSMLSSAQVLVDMHDSLQFSYNIYETLIEGFLASLYEAVSNYLQQNDDLRRLPFDERSIMLRSAGDNVACLGGGFIMHYYSLYGLRSFLSIMNSKYGNRTVGILEQAMKYADPDIVLVKLSISLFAFSENNCCYGSHMTKNLTNPITILKIQNRYAEVTWKYLLYRYGFKESVKRFLNVTMWLSATHILVFHAQTLVPHNNDIESVIEQTEVTFILDDVDELIDKND